MINGACHNCGRIAEDGIAYGNRFLCPQCGEARLRDLKDRLDNNPYRKMLQKLVDRLDFVHSSDQFWAVWALAQNHMGVYKGPRYEDELEEARALLKEGEKNGG